MSEAFLPWLDKLQKLYNGSDGRDISDTDESQEWINKLRNRITQRKYNEKLNKDLYKLVSAASVNNLASNMLSEGYHCFACKACDKPHICTIWFSFHSALHIFSRSALFATDSSNAAFSYFADFSSSSFMANNMLAQQLDPPNAGVKKIFLRKLNSWNSINYKTGNLMKVKILLTRLENFLTREQQMIGLMKMECALCWLLRKETAQNVHN